MLRRREIFNEAIEDRLGTFDALPVRFRNKGG